MANSFLILCHANRREKVSKSDCAWPSPPTFFHEAGGGSTCRDKRGAGRNERVDNRAERTRSNGESLCGDYLRRQAGRGGWRPREKGRPAAGGEGWRARLRKRVRGRKAYRVGKYVARGTDA